MFTYPITTHKLFDAVTILATKDSTSEAVDLREIAQNYDFSVEYTTTGDGTAKIEYLVCSTLDGTYLNTGTDIGSTLAAGHDILNFAANEPHLAPFMKIKVSEDGGADPIVVTLYLNVQ